MGRMDNREIKTKKGEERKEELRVLNWRRIKSMYVLDSDSFNHRPKIKLPLRKDSKAVKCN
jgi:hypothetical protein